MPCWSHSGFHQYWLQLCKSMGSDSIDLELFRFPIPSFGIRFDPSLQLLLYPLFKPVISQYPCLVGRIPDFINTGFSYANQWGQTRLILNFSDFRSPPLAFGSTRLSNCFCIRCLNRSFPSTHALLVAF